MRTMTNALDTGETVAEFPRTTRRSREREAEATTRSQEVVVMCEQYGIEISVFGFTRAEEGVHPGVCQNDGDNERRRTEAAV